jgi:leucyl-tRNA synthetase
LTTDAYVFVPSPAVGGELDLTRLRGYALADAQARFRRMRGEDVLFTVAFDSFAGDPAPAAGQSADEWVGERCGALRRQLEALAISFDWDRALVTSDPSVYRWSQWLFVKLLEADLAYQRGDCWYLRNAGFNAENDRRVGDVEGWDDSVCAAQRALLHRIDGFDFDAKALDGTTLSVFTGHPDSVGDAQFVGLSARRPEIDGWLDDPDARRRVEELRGRDWNGTPLDQMPVVEIGMSVQVPSVPQPLPILVSPAIDVRFGPAAILGIPSVDAVDKTLAKNLPKVGGLAWKVESKPPKTTPAVRYLTDDMPLTSSRAWGPPVPLVDCERCGVVGISVEALPVEPLAEGASEGTPCPTCGEPATRASGSVHPRLGAAWLEVGLAAPPADRAGPMLDSPELARRLPTSQTVLDSDGNAGLLDMRTIAKALRDLGPLASLADGEPHGPALMHGPFALEDVTAASALEAGDAEALRFALLFAAAPTKPFSGGPDALRQASAFLDDLRAFAQTRIGDAGADARIDTEDGLRRKLAAWCDTAVVRVTENLERLELHRATRNVIELLARIRDYEQRVAGHRGEVAGSDGEASAAALLTLVRLLAPLAPRLAADLWQAAGLEGAVDEAEWPRAQRHVAAA